ncbi:MAG: XdhC/CoxI family protein [Myxococcales bacterium]|jgi:xanthine dehydrogenase accessory factor|nr:XdhC/CoxI family protein [Myxococcales bacterium]
MSSPTRFVSIDTTDIDGCKNSLIAMSDGRELADVTAMRDLLSRRETGDPVALVTILQATGSAPRGMGTQMTVHSDGTIAGTVGGGNLELFVIRHALESLKDGKARHLHYDFAGGDSQNVDKACSGTTDFLIQPFLSAPRLVIFGAGHCGRALAPLAQSCGFLVTVVDERADFLDPTLFPEGVQLRQGPFPTIVHDIPFEAATTYAVIMTYGHAHDEGVLDACLGRPYRYLGLVGSKAKIGELFAHLGTTEVRRAELEQLHAPVGLDLGGRSPAEIAVSIMAELLATRYDRPMPTALSKVRCQNI